MECTNTCTQINIAKYRNYGTFIQCHVPYIVNCLGVHVLNCVTFLSIFVRFFLSFMCFESTQIIHGIFPFCKYKYLVICNLFLTNSDKTNHGILKSQHATFSNNLDISDEVSTELIITHNFVHLTITTLGKWSTI